MHGWETEEEEDTWEVDLDFGRLESDGCDEGVKDMTIAELMEWRYLEAERKKEEVMMICFGSRCADADIDFRVMRHSGKDYIAPPLNATSQLTTVSPRCPITN